MFIIDRELRLRFYRGQFSFAAGMAADGSGTGYQPGMEEIGESAPRGKAIEDYLVKILKER